MKAYPKTFCVVLVVLVVGLAYAGKLMAQTDIPKEIAEPGGVILTTGDLTKPYEVVDLIISYQEFKAFSFKEDPLVTCLKAAKADLIARAKKAGADAVVAVRFDFENRTEKDEGRLLAYGTLVKFK